MFGGGERSLSNSEPRIRNGDVGIENEVETNQGGQMRIGHIWTDEERAEIQALCHSNWDILRRIAEIQTELGKMQWRKARRLDRR